MKVSEAQKAEIRSYIQKVPANLRDVPAADYPPFRSPSLLPRATNAANRVNAPVAPPPPPAVPPPNPATQQHDRIAAYGFSREEQEQIRMQRDEGGPPPVIAAVIGARERGARRAAAGGQGGRRRKKGRLRYCIGARVWCLAKEFGEEWAEQHYGNEDIHEAKATGVVKAVTGEKEWLVEFDADSKSEKMKQSRLRLVRD